MESGSDRKTIVNTLKHLYNSKLYGLMHGGYGRHPYASESAPRQFNALYRREKERRLYKDSTVSLRYDIFFSYTASDAHIAVELCDELESANLKCYMAERDVPVGTDWDENIRNSLLTSHRIVLLITPRSLQKHWPLIETGAAWILGKEIIPAIIHINPEELPGPVKRLQARIIETMKQRKQLVAELTADGGV